MVVTNFMLMPDVFLRGSLLLLCVSSEVFKPRSPYFSRIMFQLTANLAMDG